MDRRTDRRTDRLIKRGVESRGTRLKTSLFENHESSKEYALHRHGLKIRSSKGVEEWLRNLSDLNPIENLRSQMKDLQQEERATSIAGLKNKA